jgi:polygalacturonase
MLLRSLLFAVPILAAATLSPLMGSTVFPMPLVPWDKPSEELTITAEGVPVQVGEWLPGGRGGAGGIQYCHFDCAGPASVTVKIPGAPMKEPLELASNVLPRIQAVLEGDHWRFTMPPNSKVYVKRAKTFITSSVPEADPPKAGSAGVIAVNSAGIAGDGKEAVTKKIQALIDQATKRPGGGTIYFPPGLYISGTLFMRDNVTLYLAAGAILRGAEESAEWQHRKGPHYEGTSAFIFFGNDVETGSVVGIRNAAIRGRGVVDGWGHWFRRDTINGVKGNGPGYFEGDLTVRARLIMAMKAENCSIEGVTLRNPTFWTTHILGSKKFNFTDVRIYANHRINNDGINYDSCSDSTIDNCILLTGDDSQCLKNENINDIDAPNERIRMANSITAGWGKGVKFGWAFHQARDCTYENNWLINASFNLEMGVKPIRAPGPKIAEAVNITLKNMVIEGWLTVKVGNEIEGYKLENIQILDSQIRKGLSISKANGLVLRGVTVKGLPVTSEADVALVGCTGVKINK